VLCQFEGFSHLCAWPDAHPPRELDDLQHIAEIVTPDVSTKEAFFGELARHTDAVAIYTTNGYCWGYKSDVIAKIPSAIKHICYNGEVMVSISDLLAIEDV
jgi:hypothetical protein